MRGRRAGGLARGSDPTTTSNGGRHGNHPRHPRVTRWHPARDDTDRGSRRTALAYAVVACADTGRHHRRHGTVEVVGRRRRRALDVEMLDDGAQCVYETPAPRMFSNACSPNSGYVPQLAPARAEWGGSTAKLARTTIVVDDSSTISWIGSNVLDRRRPGPTRLDLPLLRQRLSSRSRRLGR